MSSPIYRRRKPLPPDGLRELRLIADVTQETLARWLHVQPQTILRWENGKVPMPHATEIILRMLAAEASGDRITVVHAHRLIGVVS